MGFGVPAAMGVKRARPDDEVGASEGDGGSQMNMQEIATMVQEGIRVKLAVFNNGYLGMVRQWQQFFHGGRYSGTPIWSPDYVKLAAAYGIPGWRVERVEELAPVLAQAGAARGPALVEFMIEQEANGFPMIPPGATLSEPIEAAAAAVAGVCGPPARWPMAWPPPSARNSSPLTPPPARRGPAHRPSRDSVSAPAPARDRPP